MKEILFVLVFLAFCKAGTSLQCYVCGSINAHPNNCTDPFDKAELTLDICDVPKAVCLKEKVHADGYQDNVLRACVSSTYCQDTADKSIYCSTCEEDGCNASSFVIPSITINFLLISIVYNTFGYV